MSICRMCHKAIPDGKEFCAECEQKRMNQADESYLDSLLSSVSADLRDFSENTFENTPKNTPSKTKKEKHEEKIIEERTIGDLFPDEEPVEIPSDKDIDIFQNNVLEEVTEEAAQEEPVIEEQVLEEPVIEEQVLEELIIEEPIIEEPIIEEPIIEEPVIEEPAIEEPLIEEPIIEEPIIEEPIPEEPIPEEPTIDEPLIEEPMLQNESEEDISDNSSEDSNEDVDDLLDSLLADMDAAGAGGEPEPEENIDPDDLNSIFAEAENNIPDEPGQSFDPDEGIPLDAIPDDLFPEVSPEEMSGQASNIESLPEGVDSVQTKEFLTEDDLEKSGMNEGTTDEDIAAMFADINTDDIDAALSLLDGDKQEDNSSGKKEKKDKKNKKKKKSLFERLFANIEEDPAEIAKREAKEKAEQEKKILSAENKKKKKEQSKEDKEVKKAEDKIRKEEEAKKKAELQKKKKEEAQEKARKKKEEKLALEEIETNPGKINRAGATILFVIFAIITVFIIVGTNIYSYNLSIQKAQDEFAIKHYNDAYYEVYGLKIQKDDIELYDKIMTVMYVNAQLNAYDYYMASNSTELALDSLLRGLQRYDKYFELATKLDIEDDLNYVKSNILKQLSSQFGLDEEAAYEMVATRDEVDYSEYIYALLGTYEVEIGE